MQSFFREAICDYFVACCSPSICIDYGVGFFISKEKYPMCACVCVPDSVAKNRLKKFPGLLYWLLMCEPTFSEN